MTTPLQVLQIRDQAWAKLREHADSIYRVSQGCITAEDFELIRMVFLVVMGDLEFREAEIDNPEVNP